MITEVTTPSGYILDNEPRTISVVPGETYTLTFENTRLPGLLITKVDSETGEALQGAVFKVTRGDGSVAVSYTHLSERTSANLEGITDNSISGTSAELSNQRFALDGYYINIKAYLIGGNNYVKLRDIALQINFGVGYDNKSGRVTIYPGLFYGEEPNGSTGSPGSGSNVTEEMLRSWELQMVDRINEERRNAGVAELEIDDDLMRCV